MKSTAENAMSTNDKGPVSLPLVGGAATIVFVAMLVYQQLSTGTFESVCRTCLLLPFVLG